jgi:hypothetical protein
MDREFGDDIGYMIDSEDEAFDDNSEDLSEGETFAGNDFWSQDEEHGFTNEDAPDGAVALINGSYHTLNVGDPFKDAVMSLARDAGFGKFRVFVNSEEIRRPADAPEAVTENMKVEIRPYDVAGGRS